MDQFVTKGYVRGEPASLQLQPRIAGGPPPRRVRGPSHAAPPRDAGRVRHRAAHRLSGEVELGYTAADARAEAARCMKCGCKERVRLRPSPGGDQGIGDVRRAAACAAPLADRAGPPVHHSRPQQVHLVRTLRRGLRRDRGTRRPCLPVPRRPAQGRHPRRPAADRDRLRLLWPVRHGLPLRCTGLRPRASRGVPRHQRPRPKVVVGFRRAPHRAA